MMFRILKGTHLSHFHPKCPLWPRENFYEQDKPLWWGHLCVECVTLADIDAARRKSGSEPDLHYLRSRHGKSGSDPDFR